MRLSELRTGESGVIVKILGHGAFRKRVMEMGFVRGRRVSMMLQAPLNDPIKYSIMDYEVSLRRSEARLIEIEPVDKADEVLPITGSGTTSEEAPRETTFEHRSHTINVALVGNPNCGKTTLFNIVSGAKEHVGNYSGVTVDAKSGTLNYRGYHFNVIDLPGTYSLASYSPEERYVRKYLREETPDVVVNVVDGSNLERNLYLTTELIDMDRSMVIALNMFDELTASGKKLDYEMLGDMIGVPIIPTVSKKGEGVDQLLDTVIEVYEGTRRSVRHIHVNLGAEIESAVTVLKDMIKKGGETGHHFSPRYIAIKLMEQDRETEEQVMTVPGGKALIERRDQLVADLKDKIDDDVPARIAAEKYGFIAGALAETMVDTMAKKNPKTAIIDAFVTNRLFGLPLFFLIMFVIFWLTFSIGQYPMDWIQNGVDWLSAMVQTHFPDGPLKDLVSDGILGGVGGVIVFLPNILILYLCISFMEDSGYMARAAFIMDRVMHRIGLHGKSFIPLVMGFGCNVPAIMAARTIESRSSRLITILIDPFMSCSARLPLYVLFIGTFFSGSAAAVFMGLYLLGVLVAIITARLLRRFKFKKDETPFVMELPPYRMPTLKASLRHMWGKGEQYLKKMGGVILVASIIVWVLNYFPLHDNEGAPIAATSTEAAEGAIIADASTEVVGALHEAPTSGWPQPTPGWQDSTSAQPTSAQLESKAYYDEQAIDPDRDSYLEMAGKFITPVLEPLGFHWRASVAALAGVPAKEIVVSTLGVLYSNNNQADDARLGQRISAINPATGRPDFNWASALSFMVFVLLYCPCMATVTAIVRETGSLKYGAFSVLYNTIVAWLVAFLVYRSALLFM